MLVVASTEGSLSEFTMNLILPATLLCLIVRDVHSREACFDKFGCFSTDYPWSSILRPFPAPQDPKDVNTTFRFSNRVNNAQNYFETWPRINIRAYDSQKPTFFITHGYYSESNVEWFKNLTYAILNKTDSNVIGVDWKKGSSTSYMQAASNTRIVASEIARVIRYFVEQYSADVSTFHLLGHSLGAHIMGYVGKNISGIARITALDPAQPGFQGKAASIRINDSDASFIDVVHTDGKPFLPFLGLGMSESVGTVDFFVNGGLLQPNCLLDGEPVVIKSLFDIPKLTIDVMYNLATCSHSRASRYMAAAIRGPCTMWGYRYSASYSHLQYTKFVLDDECSADNCTPMGLNTPKYPARGSFATPTTGVYPFCIEDKTADNVMARVI
ncbi:pancreatic triacylglycerol lipase [Orussus abietinus]|uniref:pancreatic triacylglycerol lipase n=1 Tax=Orussus abietinus TaxID=222816 RepID=UPI00062570A0|nr:pancreatic triacylglycerol lipase [Orussus abietinus]